MLKKARTATSKKLTIKKGSLKDLPTNAKGGSVVGGRARAGY